MVAEETNWKSRLCITFKPSDGSPVVISPITNLEESEEDPAEVINSIDACNLGYSFGNPTFSLNFEVKAVNKAVFRQIYRVIRNRIRFSIVMATLSGQSDDWYLDSVEFVNCIATSRSHTVDNTGNVPTIKVNCIALGVSAANNGETITSNTVGSGCGSLS